jgi:hypothetical protein
MEVSGQCELLDEKKDNIESFDEGKGREVEFFNQAGFQ